jgi:hypothetical protein
MSSVPPASGSVEISSKAKGFDSPSANDSPLPLSTMVVVVVVPLLLPLLLLLLPTLPLNCCAASRRNATRGAKSGGLAKSVFCVLDGDE